MRRPARLAQVVVLVSSFALAGCGSGGDTPPLVSAPPPPVPTPTPPPVVSDLQTSRSFNVPAGSQDVRFDLSTSATLASQSSGGRVQIAYDAASKNYTLTSPNGRQAVFGAGDEIDPGDPTERRFAVRGTDKSDFLTLAYTGYGSSLETKSVALGFWQTNTSDGTTQNTDFDVFVYGFPSAASVIPATGSAEFQTDVFGLSTQVGSEGMAFQGTGLTVFDFARATFEMRTNISEYFLVTNDGRFGALDLTASGNIASGANSFNGTFNYRGSGKPVSGLLSGTFFGPDAKEAGGTFAGDDGLGNSVVGAFTAASRGPVQQNLSLDSLRSDQLFYVPVSQLEQRRYKDGSKGFTSASMGSNGQVTFRASDQSYRYAGYVEDESLFRPSNIVSPAQSEYTEYRIKYGAEDIELALYQPAKGGEVALTYSGFGVYRRTYDDAAAATIRQDWFGYGLDTPEGVLAARTGTGTYNGLARGIAGSRDGNRQLDITGTSQFQIDFGSQAYSGWLRLAGRDTADGSQVDFGQFDLAPGTGIFRNAFTTGLLQNGDGAGELQLRFYGPTGEELAGVFNINLPDYGIAGATAARRK